MTLLDLIDGIVVLLYDGRGSKQIIQEIILALHHRIITKEEKHLNSIETINNVATL